MKRYALVVPTSMGVRITPADRQPVHISHNYYMQATSAETNVASVPAALGLPVKVLTTFVEGSPIAAFIKADLRSRGMEFEGPEVPQGGPWGYRHQFNIADSGFGMRGPRVQNDPRRRGRPHAEREGFRPGPHLRPGGRGGAAPVRPHRGALA